jgi:diguanylate cyclase (GGDEF)-like protein
LTVVSAAALPFARHPFPAVPGMPPVLITFSLCLAAISAFAISTQYVSSRSRELLILASAYALIALLGLPELYVALAASAGFRIAPGASTILPLLSQLGFDFHVCWYLWASNRKVTISPDGAKFVSTVFSLRLVLIALIATVVAFGPWTIPPGPAVNVAAAFGLFALAATQFGRRERSILNRWLAVALVASLLGELFTAFSGARFSLGWYVASLMHLIEYGVVLGAFLTVVSIESGELATLVTLDPLTGLANRRGLDEHLGRLLSDGRRTTDTLSVLMIDIDHFKRFNDQHGHAAGDEALRVVAKALKRTLGRGQDFAARYGGEEFVILLTDIDRIGALDVAERLRARVEGLLIAHDNGSHRVTVSIGIVSVRGREQLDAAALLRTADRALYTAKALGRNRIYEERVFPKSLQRKTEDVATA